uniref:DBR1 domain-containing protein n=1 Tax=Panagrellus redivivus TaxID=6233 RepID=A0A7E4ZQM7_PANRE
MASIPPPAPVPPQLDNATEPEAKKPRIDTTTIPADDATGQRQLHLAVAGCSHGEMDKIYSTLAVMARNRGYPFDLLICCGDYQALRNNADMKTIHVNQKYQNLGTFHQYYSGKKIAPILTIFIGGNHESAGFLAELPYGGWVAPNIYYLGFSSVIRFAGLRIAGLSGIFKKFDYHKGHFERPPFPNGSMISAYHVRSVDILRLKQLEATTPEDRVDIMVSHDWPVGITDHGNTPQLLRFKPFFTEDIQNKRLGNPHTMEVLQLLKPRFWFAAHLHCRYEASVPHPNAPDFEDTYFLALDKPVPKRKFLEAIDIPIADDAKMELEYDPVWLAILRATDEFTSISERNVYLPASNSFKPSPESVEAVKAAFDGDLTIPRNFQPTAPPYQGEGYNEPCLYYRNPQTTEFCDKLNITNLNRLLYESNNQFIGIPFFELAARANVDGTEVIDVGDDESGDEYGEEFFASGSTSAAATEAPSEPAPPPEPEYKRPVLQPRETVGERLLKRRPLDLPEDE